MGFFSKKTIASTALVVAAVCCGHVFGDDDCVLQRGQRSAVYRIKACLDAFTIDPSRAYHTISHLRNGLGNYYSFTDIAANSQASVEDTKPCKLPVHDVKNDIIVELDNMKADVAKDFGVTDFEELLDKSIATKTISGYKFHMRIVHIFRKLFDAHTTYSPPWAPLVPYFELVPQVKLGVERDGETMIVKLDGQPVKSMGGMDPWEFIKQQANERVGGVKSLGGRVNSYIQTWNSNIFPGTEYVHWDGIEVEYQYVPSTKFDFLGMVPASPFSFFSDSLKKDDFQAQGKAISWTKLQQWLDTYSELKPVEASLLLEDIAKDMGSFNETKTIDLEIMMDPEQDYAEMDGVDESTDFEETFQAAKELFARRLGSEKLELVDHWPKHVKLTNGKDVPAMFAGYWLPESKTAVLKISSFMTPASMYGPQLEAVLGVNPAINNLFALHRMLVAKGGKRIIIDLSGNGGGYVELANLVSQMFAPHLGTQTELASDYAMRVGDFWNDWLASFGWNERKAIADKLRNGEFSEEEVKQMATGLLNLYTLKESVGPPPFVPSTEYALKSITNGLGSKSDNADMLARGIEGEFFTEMLVGSHKQGWFPFTDQAKDPETGKAFSPYLEPYLKPETHDWGGKEDTYAQKYIFSCELPWDKGLGCWDHSKHQWPEMAILTDGTCGSACALVASKLQFAAGATVFSYGGVPGEVMDTAAFAGGNVYPWDDIWRVTFYAALIGDTITGRDTAIGKRLRQEKANERHYSRTLPLPMPTAATARFNFNMMFVPELGDNALPREWYVIGAHRHYDVWEFPNSNDMDTWSNVWALYARVAGEDWKATRLAGVGGKDAEALTCAKPPPPLTWQPKCGLIPFAVKFIFWLSILCCVGCCVGCCVMASKSMKGSSAGAARQAEPQPGSSTVELRTVETPAYPYA